MQRGIDSFFKRVPNNKTSDEDATSPPTPAPRKRKALVISSDEDEVVPASPQISKHGKEVKKARKATSENGHATKKPSLSKLKEPPKQLKKVDPSELFGGETKRVEAPKLKPRSVIELEDEDIDRSLMEVDVDEPTVSPSASRKRTKPSPEVRAAKALKTEAKADAKTPKADAKTPKADAKTPKANAKTPKTDAKTPKADAKTPKAEDKTPKSKTPKSTPRAKQEKHTDLETSVLSDEERHERKRMAAVLYQKFKNRSSCLNPGSKEIPKGAPDCLKGLTFLVTGVLESMERDEAASVIKGFGGRVMTVVGKKLNYLIVGEDAGPKKLAQAEEHNITILSEDGLFDLIRERSGEKKNVKLETSPEDRKEHNKSGKHDEKSSTKIKKEHEEKSSSKAKKEHEERNSLNIKKEQVEKTSPKTKEKQQEVKSKEERSPKIKSEPAVSSIKTEPNNNLDAAKREDLSINMAWVDKYKPSSIKEIVGQAGPNSNVNKLMNWLTKWYVNHDGTKKTQRPNPWAKNDDGSFFKAALLSGPPGIGKTTTATLVCQELGFDAVEFNASDTRSKRLLKEEVSSLLGNKSLAGYVNGKAQAVSKKHVLIMDEVDGMAGNEDRGGMQELIALIKDSSVPIICMCNDRNHVKIRSLANYCYDLRFQRPRVEQIKGRVMSICFKEKLKIPPAKLEEIITATNNDIRQTINHIALLSAGEQLSSQQQVASKDLKLGPWEVVRKVFTAEEHKNMSIYDKCDLFFHDYSLAPLFVQQNYLQVTPQGNRKDVLAKVAATADALSLGDMVDKRIRANSAWSLLPTQAVFSSLLPGEYMCGHFTGQINFPGWLGKNSKSSKRSRLGQELHDHTRICTSGSKLSVRLEYAPFLLANIVRPLAQDGQEGVASALQVMKDYHLLCEDLKSLIELTTWPGKKSPMDAVDGRVKAALTRTYNKEVMPYSYSAQATVKKKRAETAADEEEAGLLYGEEDGEGTQLINSSDEEDDDNLELDALIKTKKPAAAAKKPAATAKKSAASGKKANEEAAPKTKARAKK